jgi:hypothetical protein
MLGAVSYASVTIANHNGVAILIRHELAEFVGHTPRRLVSDLELTLKFLA